MWIPDATALRDFRACPEIFRLRHRLHLAPGPEPKRDAGSAAHAALDVWFRRPTSDVETMLATLSAAMPPDDPVSALSPVATPRGLAHMGRVLREYAERWPRERDPFEVVRNEEYAEGTVGVGWGGGQAGPDGGGNNARVVDDAVENGELAWRAWGAHGIFRYGGIIDRKVRLGDGSEYIVDVKTTGARATPAYEQAASVSDQMIGYVALERANGRRCDGFYIDHIHIEDKSQSVEAKHFTRLGPFHAPAWRVERWAADALWTLQEIARLDQGRGLDTPWPVYHNWAYGKIDATWWPFIREPAELHAQLAAAFERDEWNPRHVAARRKTR